MTTDSLIAGAGHWSAVRFFIEQFYCSIAFSEPYFFYDLTLVYMTLQRY